jgi:hypothetical protein
MTPSAAQTTAPRSRSLGPPSYDALEPEAKALVDRWVAGLASAPVESATVFKFLLAMVSVRLGTVRELRRLVREGRPVVILVDPASDNCYQLNDPQLGEAEPAAVDALLRMLGGDG